MEARELERRIAAFPRWRYAFSFQDGVTTPVADRSAVNRHEQRRRYFFEPLLRLTGGTLAGRRVLDLGCNAGWWSLLALEAGAEFVLGLDGRQEYLDQAALVFEAKQIDPARYRFEQGDVFSHEFPGRYDVVLCLGLLDHVSRPVELFEVMSGVGAELILIDAEVSRARSALFEVSTLYETGDVLDHPLVLIPSREAVVQLARRFGYETVALAQDIGDYAGMQDYRRMRRQAFICSSGTSLAGLPAHRDGAVIPWWVRDPRALLTE
jgi:tRNA (mo5U34)-methyltransferase